MKPMSLAILFICLFFSGFSQGIQGQWKGSFGDNSSSYLNWGGSKSEYVLELEVDGSNNVSGYSYTYFYEDGKKYYTICKLKGSYKTKSRYIEVIEYERTKTNVPINVNNCFQIHKLSYYKKGNEESLEGAWIPAPNQAGDCGFGTTLLTKRVIKNMPAFSPSKTTSALTTKKNNTASAKSKTSSSNNTTTSSNGKKKSTNTEPAAPLLPKLKDKQAVALEQNSVTKAPAQSKKINAQPALPTGFEKRNLAVVKTIVLDADDFTIDLYDNGDIDGDSISVIYNGTVLVNKKKLTDQAISLKLKYDENAAVHELVMYAENLGTIPPNTAVMIVRDKGHRYEVRITSDLQKSGTVRFSRKNE